MTGFLFPFPPVRSNVKRLMLRELASIERRLTHCIGDMNAAMQDVIDLRNLIDGAEIDDDDGDD